MRTHVCAAVVATGLAAGNHGACAYQATGFWGSRAGVTLSAVRPASGSHRAAPSMVTASRPGTAPGVSSDAEPVPPRQRGAWTPQSWRERQAYQQPKYEDLEALAEVEARLRTKSPLVFAGECRDLTKELAQASQGKGFVLMGGDCAESLENFHVDNVRDSFRVILQMALILTYGGGLPVTKIGRMAGQFAKPRSDDYEEVDGVKLPSYRGDIINGAEFTPESRENDPVRMIAAYDQSAQTLNILRAFSQGGYADLSRLHTFNLDFVEQTEQGSAYRQLSSKIDEAIRFMRAIGVDTQGPEFSRTKFYTAHECLLLPYEEALTRADSTSPDGRLYDCSAHMLWIGERTRQIEAAHLEFVRGIGNPIGIKISSKCTPDELRSTLDVVNPDNIPGRVTLITRMSPEKLESHLPKLIRAVQADGRNVLWVCDPVHGNTIKSSTGVKTRPFEKIRAELRAFFNVHRECGTHPGGVHVEMTGQDVTECLGGTVDEVLEVALGDRYETPCDPRLNGKQSLELAFLIAEKMRKDQGLPPVLQPSA